MSVKLFDLIDITDKVKNTGRTKVSLNDVVGLLSDRRTYELADSDGTLSAFTPNGQLNINDWRNQTITETDPDNESTPKFTGSIFTVGRSIDDRGYTTKIEARSPLAVVLQFVVEENDVATYSGFSVNGNTAIGAQTVALSGGSGSVPVGTQVTFSTDLVPRYEVKAASGSPTSSITLDRPLEIALTNADPVRFSVPVFKTAAGAIFDALNTAGVPIENLGSSFASINSVRLAAGHTIRMHLRIEDRITTAQHISELLKLGDLYLTTDRNGIINVVEGLAFDGVQAGQTLGENEISAPANLVYDTSRLYQGYDCLYHVASDSSVAIASGDADQYYVDRWAAQARFQPIEARSSLSIDYRYLYNNATTADFYGLRILDYFQVPRVNLQCVVKGFANNNPCERIQASLVEDYNVSLPISSGNNIAFEPAKVIAADYNETTQQSQLTLQFTNAPLPGFFKNVVDPETPVVVSVTPEQDGFTAVFNEIDSNLNLIAEIFFTDQVTLLLEPQLAFVNASGQSTARFGSSLLLDGQQYFVRFRTNFRGTLDSEPTALFPFVPQLDILTNLAGDDLQNLQLELINRG